jgi:sn-glycerol 3-phosphate transport system ATP-binding protein
MGADYLLHVSTPIGTLRFSRRHRGAVPEKGDADLGFSPADVHLFHAEQQHNLLHQAIVACLEQREPVFGF